LDEDEKKYRIAIPLARRKCSFLLFLAEMLACLCWSWPDFVIQTREIQINGETKTVVVSKVFDNEDFGFRKITVERPLRLNFQARPERIARVEEETSFLNLASSKKKVGEGPPSGNRGRQEAARGHPRSTWADVVFRAPDAPAGRGGGQELSWAGGARHSQPPCFALSGFHGIAGG
jgi:hypothetical protein